MSKPPTNEELHLKLSALRFWLLQAYAVMSDGRPDLMAASVRRKTQSMRNWSPPDSEMTAGADLDRTFMAILPELESLGNALADDLERYAREIASDQEGTTP